MGYLWVLNPPFPCWCRSNDSGSIGFASNPRRLCVGLSRAQKSLTVFGNATTFEPRGRGGAVTTRIMSTLD